ncbi:hypothetical protein SAMN05421504_102924 [Amycolatopsis xylanica]|uniref:Transcriptional regulator, AbiEi antitoxin, Type IV TA system n=1 Tax=Amycolatopsis xylanica TaxID=589385 RepID=A0A1H3AH41_9PSEU|nr:hypothetical protein [Amycolatopsis xylanica]SDX28996.1 hypothetical protein SAMN05421504_102924 [Amycolatopsis xylanica]
METGETKVLEQGIHALQLLLGEQWTLELPSVTDIKAADDAFDAHVRIAPPGSGDPRVELLVQVRENLTPRDALAHLAPVAGVLRRTQAQTPLLVLSSWLSPRTRQVLTDKGIGYLDLTGNAELSVSRPAIRLLTHGADKAPNKPVTQARNVTLKGSRAGRVVRFLADFAPPYQGKQIAEAAAVGAPWVSKLLGQLESELLVRRDGRTVAEVDWPELLRARARSYDLLKHNAPTGLVAPQGIDAVLEKIRTSSRHRIAITGPFAARAVAPLTTGGQLMAYVDDVDAWVDELGLLRVDENADVLLLRAHDDVVFERTRVIDGITHVALTQLVLDGLAGPGRMPAEAEAVLERLVESEAEWRRPWMSPDR